MTQQEHTQWTFPVMKYCHGCASVAALVTTIEDATGLQVRFARLPATSHVSAGYAFNPHNNAATISLAANWEDVDVAHELTHMQLELLDGYSVLAWRQQCPAD